MAPFEEHGRWNYDGRTEGKMFCHVDCIEDEGGLN